VDDDAGVREGLARLLTASGHAVAAFPSGEAFLASAEAARAACALLDLRMGSLSGLDLQEELARRHPALFVLFLTAHGDVAAGVRAIRKGAVDFLQKPVDDARLLAAVAHAIRSGAAQRTRHAARDAARARLERLSPREREIMDHVVRGRLNKQIAADLRIAEATVKQHRGRVMEKLEVRSVADLVRLRETAEESHQGRMAADTAGT
jgi:FixJ family two-component response regulator